jgi:flagellar basal-body rod protein FlgB
LQIFIATHPKIGYPLLANRENFAYISNMDLGNIPLFGIMRTKLSYLSERQSVLAQNIANGDTPGYRAQDIAEPDFKKMVKASGINGQRNLQMTLTNSKHIAKTAPSAAFRADNRRTTYELNPNENNVVIEEEISKMAMNQADYQKALNLYSKGVAMFKVAIGKQG